MPGRKPKAKEAAAPVAAEESQEKAQVFKIDKRQEEEEDKGTSGDQETEENGTPAKKLRKGNEDKSVGDAKRSTEKSDMEETKEEEE